MAKVALGLAPHSGWAALVALGGKRDAPAVLARTRVEMADPGDFGAKAPYHAVEGLALAEAQQRLNRFEASAERMAGSALRALVGELRAKGHSVRTAGILESSGRKVGSLSAILASHALIHTADGELYRDALADAAAHCRLPLLRVREREAMARAVQVLKVPEPVLARRLGEMGRPFGPPWRQDEKLAALVAWLALAGAAD